MARRAHRRLDLSLQGVQPLARRGAGRRRRAGPGAGPAGPPRAAHPRAAPPLPRLPAQGRAASALGTGRSCRRSERHAARRPPRPAVPRARRRPAAAQGHQAGVPGPGRPGHAGGTLQRLRAAHARDAGHPARDAPTRHWRGWRRPSSLGAAGDGLHAPGQGRALQAGGQAAPVRGLFRLERVSALPDAGPAGSRPLHSLLPAARAPRVAHRLRRRAGHLRRHSDLRGSGRPAQAQRDPAGQGARGGQAARAAPGQ